MPHHVASQIITPLAESDRSKSLNNRGRKMSSAGGNRSWSEEEENYLLQTRAQKMPYKHIAAHLKKTELACRLHYHQLSHGSHRRKRTGSVSSAQSHASCATHSSGSSPRSHYQYGYDHEADDAFGFSPARYNTTNTSASYTSHKVLLPKPTTMTPPDQYGLRINTAMQNNGPVDPDRLRAIYDQHRSTFWSAIAQEYGADASPGQLEAMWQTQTTPMLRPPTPGDSPDRLRSSFKPSPMPLYNPYSAASTVSSMGSLGYGTTPSAVSAPDRMGYYTPQTPSNHYGHAGLTRHNTWGYPTSSNAPTAISSLLTENKCPRGSACTGANCGQGHC